MPSRPVSIPTYTKNVSQIQSGLQVKAAPHVNNFANIETTAASLETTVEDHDERFKGIERQSFVKYFDDSKVSTGTNTITIGGAATIINTIDSAGAWTQVTGFADSGSISVSGITNGVMWAISNTLTYQPTNADPASRPANGYRVFTFTNSGGAVTVNPKTFENAIDADNHIFSGSFRVVGNPTFDKGILPIGYHDVRLQWTDANTITVLAGSRVRSSDNTEDIIFSANRTCVLNASGANGLDTGAEASNTWYYLYAIYNPTTLTSALLFSTVNEAVSGSITLPSGFTKKRQLKFAARNDASSNILEFFGQPASGIYYVAEQAVLTNFATASFTTTSLANFVPAISRLAVMTGSYGTSGGVQTFFYVRPTGSSDATGKQVTNQGLTSAILSTTEFVTGTNSSQQFDVRGNNTSTGARFCVVGWIPTEV